MLNHKEIVEWLWENCRDEDNNLILSGLDLRDFNNVYFSRNLINQDLIQANQTVGGDLYQHNQKVKGKFYNHKLEKNEYW